MLIVWFFVYKKLAQFGFGVLCLPGDQSHPVCATVNKPSFVLHLLYWLIGSRGFSSLERRPEFWVLHYYLLTFYITLPTIYLTGSYESFEELYYPVFMYPQT